MRNGHSCVRVPCSFVPQKNDPVEAFFRNRVEADDATVQRLAELDMFFLRTLPVYNVDRVVVRLHAMMTVNVLCPTHPLMLVRKFPYTTCVPSTHLQQWRCHPALLLSFGGISASSSSGDIQRGAFWAA